MILKIYIHTIPKAGTYLLAEYIENLGFHNTGYHISQNNYLDTKSFNHEENAVTPSITAKNKFFIAQLRSLRKRDVAFGHLPAPLVNWLFPDMYFVCAYRNPRKTLVSEFVDFRFRRSDVRWLSKEKIAGDADAFATYLRNHGAIHMSIFSQMLAAATLFQDPIFTRYEAQKAIFVNFDDFLAGPGEARRIAEFLGVDVTMAEEARTRAISAETKTKATNLDIDRAAFWTEEAEAIYHDLQIPAYIQKAVDTGWNI